MLESRIVTGIAPSPEPPQRIAREFRKRLEAGARLLPAGEAKQEPAALLAGGRTPRYRVALFDATFYLTNLRFDDNFRFFVAYVVLPGARRESVYPRIFYKDSSLVWRSATHFIRTDDENWIGKGDLLWTEEHGHEVFHTAEETTNLPLELQPALDLVSRMGPPARRDNRAVPLVLRRGPEHRIAPYADFIGPRRRAAADPANVVNGGHPIAHVTRPGDPSSLRFVAGFDPDFSKGVLEVAHSKSRIYGGEIAKHRILSKNGRIQYHFVASPKQVWIIPPQTLTTELSSYGVRTIDVLADEDLCVPGYEYHFMDESEDPPTLHSQIPEGYAGEPSEVDPSRADASPWLEGLPVIREFRKKVLGAA